MDAPPIRILMVEDNPSDALLLRETIADCYPGRYATAVARTLEEARSLVAQQKFDAALLDLSLPDSRGLDTIERFSDSAPSVPIVVLTGLDDEETALEAVRRGAQDYLLKGRADGCGIARAIRYAIERKQAEESLKRAYGELEGRVQQRTIQLVRANEQLTREIEERKQVERRLAKASEEWKTTFDAVRDPMMILDRDFRIVRVNAASQSLFCAPQEELLGKRCHALMHGTSTCIAGCPFALATQTKRHEDAEIHDEQRDAWLLVTADPLLDADGEVAGIVHSIKDITERKRAEEKLRRSEMRFRFLVSAVHDYAIFGLGPDGRVASWNAGAERIKGYREEEILGQHFSRFYTDEDVSAGKPDEGLDAARNLERYEDEGWRVRKDGSRFWAHVLMTAMTDASGQLLGFAKVTRDLTERRQAEEAQRMLAGRLLTAQEAERRRLAREMHDDLTQRLAVLAIEAGKLEQECDLAGRSSVRLQTMKEHLIHLSQDVHALSRQLHPSILEDLGLVEALRSECGSFSQREGVAVRYAPQNIPPEVPKEVALCLYRIAQEGLRNVAKHSAAKEASVSLTATDDTIMLSIEDRGAGFDHALARGEPGLGLESMEERARLIGGEFSIRSEPGLGTLIEVCAPLSRTMP
jgi:PAS domain S-box-containing protein